MLKRPTLNKEISLADFKEFYWLKNELLAFCKKEDLSRSGGKIEVAKRIIHYLETGERLKYTRKAPAKSSFDWSKEILTLNTPITDNYSNTEHVRSFFGNQLGKQFKFNVKFMNWMKANEGKTLEDAIQEWKQLQNEKKTNKKTKNIEPQFEYNRYLRDFLADNPDKNKSIGIKLWKLKSARRGDNVYKKSDLDLLLT